MIAWTKSNNIQLTRLKELIFELSPTWDIDKKELSKGLNEFKKIIRNKTLDLNNEMGILEKPLIIEAAIWQNSEIIKLLLEKNIRIYKTVNFYKLYGEEEEYDYCPNIDKNCLDILYDDKKQIENEINLWPSNTLKNINDCIEIIENHIKIKNIGIIRFSNENYQSCRPSDLISLFPY